MQCEIPFEEGSPLVTSHPDDVAAIRGLGRSEEEAARAALALAMCDDWLKRLAQADTTTPIDRQRFLECMNRFKRAGTSTWGVEATSTLIALAINQSLRNAPLNSEQTAMRDQQRQRVRDAIVSTVASIERQSGRTGFAMIASVVEKDASAGFDRVIASEWSCVGQVPISSERFDKLISTMTEVRDAAVTEAATKLAAQTDAREYPNIAADAVADVLRDALNGYARAAFVDGFAHRGTPLRFSGFRGEIPGRLSAISMMPTGELPMRGTLEAKGR
jgi:hypothetical protein